MADFGIKISQEGNNVLNLSEKDVLLSSSYPSFKVYLTGTESFSIDATGIDDITITHSLGYTPGFLVYYEVAATSRRFLADTWWLDEASGISAYCSMTDTTLVVHLAGPTEGQSGTIRYFIFRDVLV